MVILFIFLISLFISLFITANIRKLRFATIKGISQAGGVAIWFSFLAVCLPALIFKIQKFSNFKEILGIFSCSTVIFIIGLIDDIEELSVTIKFLTQLAIASIVIIFGVRTQIVGLGFYGNILVTLLWILGITNAFNHLDVTDGLSAGIAFISSLTFLIFSVITYNFSVALIFAALAGSIFGFLRYNYPNASIYMGNSGSHFLGFILSTLAIMINYANLEKRIALIVPILVLGFPIFDTIFVIWVRFLKHRPVWLKSNDHLSLRLISLGLSKKKAVMCMFLFAIVFCIASICILSLTNKLGFILLTLIFIMCIYISLKMKGVRADE